MRPFLSRRAGMLLVSGAMAMAVLMPAPSLAQADPAAPATAPSVLTPPSPESSDPANPAVAQPTPPSVLATDAPPVEADVRSPPALGPSAPLPGFPGTGPAPGVVDDPRRVFGDDAREPVGLDLLGSVIGGFGFGVSAGLTTEYNSNFALLPADAPLPDRFESRDDWRISPSISAQIARPLGQQRIFATGQLGYDFFLNNSGFNRFRVGINGGLDLRLGSRCSGLVSGGWNERSTPNDDFAFGFAINQQTSNYGASAGCTLTSGLGFNAGVRRSFINNGSGEVSALNLNSTSWNGSIFYSIGQRGTISVNGFLARTEFPGQVLPDGSINAIDISGLSVGASYRIGPSLSVNGQFGRSWVRPDNPIGEDSSGNNWSLGLSYSGSKLGASIGTSQSFVASRNGFVGAQQVNSLNASLTYRANDRLTAAIGYIRVKQDFLLTTQIPGVAPPSSLTDNRASAGLDYQLSRLLSLSANVNYLDRTTTAAGFGANNTRVGLTLRASI